MEKYKIHFLKDIAQYSHNFEQTRLANYNPAPRTHITYKASPDGHTLTKSTHEDGNINYEVFTSSKAYWIERCSKGKYELYGILNGATNKIDVQDDPCITDYVSFSTKMPDGNEVLVEQYKFDNTKTCLIYSQGDYEITFG